MFVLLCAVLCCQSPMPDWLVEDTAQKHANRERFFGPSGGLMNPTGTLEWQIAGHERRLVARPATPDELLLYEARVAKGKKELQALARRGGAPKVRGMIGQIGWTKDGKPLFGWVPAACVPSRNSLMVADRPPAPTYNRKIVPGN